MNDITTLGLVVIAKRDQFSSDLRIYELQTFPLTDSQAKEITKEYDKKDISTQFSKFAVNRESSMRWFLRYVRQYGSEEEFQKAYDLVMTYADSDIIEKVIAFRQKGLFDSWLNNVLDESGCPTSNTKLPDADAEKIDNLSRLLDMIDDAELKEEVMTKFKASLRGRE